MLAQKRRPLPPGGGGATTFPDETRPGDSGKKRPPVTTITVELLTGPSGVGLKARQWAEILGKLDVVVTVRNGRSDEKLGVTERKTGGTLRSVQVVGFLDTRRDGLFFQTRFSTKATATSWQPGLTNCGPTAPRETPMAALCGV